MSYSEAKKKYAAVGVDTERAIAALKRIPISLNSWQLDDIGGWEHPVATAPGNYPGRPRTPEELFADLDLALRLIPGRH
ncbi:MAG: L-rhamnose isomerase, partial [bacterium]|nr:L-rhamnose isomerase [Candidatus Colisoma equi]